MKKIYFACSIRGGREDAAIYSQLVEIINNYARVLSELFGDEDLPHKDQKLDDEKIWSRDIGWLKQADGVIAEVSTPSLGVGYELAKAEEWDIPVLALYRPRENNRLSAMIAAAPKIKLAEYQNLIEAESLIREFTGKL